MALTPRHVCLGVADLTGANLTAAHLEGAHFEGTHLDGTELDRATWPEAVRAPDGWARDPDSGRLGRVSDGTGDAGN